MRTPVLVAFLVALVMTATDVQALSTPNRCEATKNKVAAKYAYCRQKAEAKAIKTGNAPDYAKCDDSFTDMWTKAETDASGFCPSTGDLEEMREFITRLTREVATGLGGGPLLCTCGTSECPASEAFPASGQTTAYGAGSDGDLQAGAALSYTDNGDGTITDNNTGLMWEKKDDAGGIHDKDNYYTWGMTTPPYAMSGTMVTQFLASLNAAGGFAGHTDWRIPNVKELQSIVNYEVAYSDVSVDVAFNTNCTPGCSADGVGGPSCSCTNASWYHSSTTSRDSPWFAYGMNAAHTGVFGMDKNYTFFVRAVRGGL